MTNEERERLISDLKVLQNCVIQSIDSGSIAVNPEIIAQLERFRIPINEVIEYFNNRKDLNYRSY
jgi:hypothetical protein